MPSCFCLLLRLFIKCYRKNQDNPDPNDSAEELIESNDEQHGNNKRQNGTVEESKGEPANERERLIINDGGHSRNGSQEFTEDKSVNNHPERRINISSTTEPVNMPSVSSHSADDYSLRRPQHSV